jgi:hypothetical protein
MNKPGKHLNEQGQFQSDRFPSIGPDKLVLSFHDPEARHALTTFAHATANRALAYDIMWRMEQIDRARQEEEAKNKSEFVNHPHYTGQTDIAGPIRADSFSRLR